MRASSISGQDTSRVGVWGAKVRISGSVSVETPATEGTSTRFVVATVGASGARKEKVPSLLTEKKVRRATPTNNSRSKFLDTVLMIYEFYVCHLMALRRR